MALTKEQLLTLTCLKDIGVKGIGIKKILSIGNSTPNIPASYNELFSFMNTMKEKVIQSVTLEDLMAANRIAVEIINHSESIGVGLIGYFDEEFPATLRTAINEEGKLDAPVLLWYRGDLAILQLPGFAVIGTREPTPEGEIGGVYLASEIARRGFNIVSGLAIGCDTFGHRGALRANGKTTAILANGLDHNSIYPPENQELAEEIVRKGGLLLSEYRIGTRVNRYSLVARDRLQAGLALATLVIQTGERGGTMHAANTTLMAKKPLYAILYKNAETNNHPKCQGNRLLVEKGAKYIAGGDNLDELCDSLLTNKKQQPTQLDLFS